MVISNLFQSTPSGNSNWNTLLSCNINVSCTWADTLASTIFFIQGPVIIIGNKEYENERFSLFSVCSIYGCLTQFFFYQGFLSWRLTIHRTIFSPLYHFYQLTNTQDIYLQLWDSCLVLSIVLDVITGQLLDEIWDLPPQGSSVYWMIVAW